MNEQKVPRHKKSFKVSNPNQKIEVTHKWTVLVLFLTFILSVFFSFVTSQLMTDLSIFLAFIVLLAIIIINIAFDMVGTAVASAEESPFHSLATRKVKGASQSVRIIRHAPQMANLCNDVIGDIAGIISGASTALIIAELASIMGRESIVLSLSLTGIVASMTIGGKAFFKGIAMKNCNNVVFFIGKLLYIFESVAIPFKRNTKRK